MHKILRNLMLLLIIFIVCFSFYSCSNEYSALGGNCLECLSEQPDSANLVVYVTINAENPKVPLIIYRGVFDPNNLPNIEVIDTAISSTYTYYVPLYHNFSVKAEYTGAQR